MRRLSSERARWLAQNVIPHERAIRAWLYRRAYNIDVDDVIQEMYAKLAALETTDNIRSPRQYAARTAYSIIANQRRRSRVVPISSVGDLDELGLFSPDASPESQLEIRDELQELQTALAELPERCRQAFLMRRAEGLSQKEVAARLGVSEKSVEKYMAQGVRLLIEVFGRGGKSGAQLSNASRRPAMERRRK
jgi:RNA polymerase sigma factor (sigma-70 family)